MDLELCEIYSLNHLNENSKTIFGIPPIKEDYVSLLNNGYKKLCEKELILNNELVEELIIQAILLEKYNKCNEYICFGNINIGYSKKEMIVYTLSNNTNNTFTLAETNKGYEIFKLILEVPFLRKQNNVEDSKEDYIPIAKLNLSLGAEDSMNLRHYQYDKLQYNCLLVDFYDRVLEYNYQTGKAKSISANKIKKMIQEWTNVGQEYERNFNRF